MSLFEKDHSLKALNTFGVDVKAKLFAVINHEEQYSLIHSEAGMRPWMLGGGSNLLLTGDIDTPVLKNGVEGIEIVETHDQVTRVRVGGGVVWHKLVLWAVENGLGGIENLSLIPGSVGASPIQNIGAYGVELKDVFHSLEAIDLETGEHLKFNKDECRFGYRDSIFKDRLKGRLCISRVSFDLTNAEHAINAEYGAIRDTLDVMGVREPSIRNISDAVIAIRSSKLPDPDELGNSGSFFKNPIVPISIKEAIEREVPDVVWYPVDDQHVKIPAGWLIERCGWKGRRIGNVGCFDKQALVIVNYGGATGIEIYEFAMQVQASVFERFGVELTPEVNII